MGDLSAAADGLDCIPSPIDSPSLASGYSSVDFNAPLPPIDPNAPPSPVKSSMPTDLVVKGDTSSSASPAMPSLDINAMIAEAVAAVCVSNRKNDDNSTKKSVGGMNTEPRIFSDA